jgi:hypothetical protein
MHSEIIIAPAAFTMIGFVIWIVATSWQRRLRLKLTADFNAKLLDRIGSVKDFNEFLQTDGGSRFMDSLTIERPVGRPHDGILRAVQIGIILVMLSLGFLGLGWYFTRRYGAAGDDFEMLTMVGVVAGSLGLGFLISAGASYRLAKLLGVLAPSGRANGGA